MRIFSDAVEMIKEVERDLFEMGTRYQSKTVQDQSVADNPDFQTIELCGYAYMLTDFDKISLEKAIEHTGYAPIDWVREEAHERIHGSQIIGEPLNPGYAWRLNKKLWEPFLRNGVFSYSYAERWKEQIPYIIHELKEKPETRQAVLTMYDRHQDMMNWGGKDRVPCSLTYQFILREGKLVCIYNQRSCDFIKFLAADVYFTVALMNHIAMEIGVECGQFIHFLGSLHAFAGDLKDREIF